MTQGSRFGKYGEVKRYDRLRRSKTAGLGRSTPQPGLTGKRPLPPARRKEGGRIKIHRARRRSEVDFIRRLSREVFRIYGTYDEIIPQWFEAAIAFTLVAYSHHRPVGFAMLAPIFQEWRPADSYELMALAVRPEDQGRGIGGRLLDEIEKWAVESHAMQIVLHTAKENLPAQRLFSTHGYRSVGIKKGFYPEGQDAVTMVKDIHETGPPRPLTAPQA